MEHDPRNSTIRLKHHKKQTYTPNGMLGLLPEKSGSVMACGRFFDNIEEIQKINELLLFLSLPGSGGERWNRRITIS